MKTIELDLKKKVLIVQPDETGNMYSWIKIYSDNWDFKGLGSELTEEIASEFISDFDAFNEFTLNYEYLKNFIYIIATKGFYWLENPIKHPKDYEVFPDSLSLYAEQEKLHLEAEENTFLNPLIFVKK